MVTLEQFLVGIKFRITEGSDFLWQCYGPAAHRIESYIDDEYSAEVIFDRNTQTIYEASVCDYRTNHCYRLFNPDHKAANDKEAEERKVEKTVAWDEVKWIDLETDEDFLGKLKAIVEGLNYDRRVSVPIDLSQDEMFELMKIAHEKDITLNQLVEEIIMDAVERHELSMGVSAK